MTNNPNYPINVIGCKDMSVIVTDDEVKVTIGESRMGTYGLPIPHSYLVIKMPKSAHFKTLIIGLTEDPMFCASDRYMYGNELSVNHCKTSSEIELFLNGFKRIER